MKRIILTEKQIEKILNEEESNIVKCVAIMRTPEEAEKRAEEIRREMGLDKYRCYCVGTRVLLCLENDRYSTMSPDDLFNYAKNLGTKGNYEKQYRTVSESAPGFKVTYPKGWDSMPTKQKAEPVAQKQAPSAQKNFKPRPKIDYNSVRLVNDPKVRSGEDWGKHGGNFPVERGGHVYYVSRSVAVSMYTFCKDKDGNWCVLANQRGPGAPTSRGLWNVPCGYLDYGESAPEAAAREAREETGVDIPLDKIKMMGVNSNPSHHPHASENVTIRFAAVLDNSTENYPVSSANCEPGEVTDVKWIPLTDIGKYKWAFGQEHKIIPQAKTSLNYINGVTVDDLDSMVSSLKSEIRNLPYAQQLLDNILKKLNYTENNKSQISKPEL